MLQNNELRNEHILIFAYIIIVSILSLCLSLSLFLWLKLGGAVFDWFQLVRRISGVCWLMERFGSDFKKVNLDNVLGPIVQTNILKNKSFLLTCTIPIKSTTNGSNERQVCISIAFI